MTAVTARDKKTLIGVLASHEDERRHDELVELLDTLVHDRPADELEPFAFVFTGGTYRRLLFGKNPPENCRHKSGVAEPTRKFLLEKCGVIRLPQHRNGGVVLLAYLVVHRRISIIWSFLSPVTSHWLQPENVALIRLCDHWHVNRLLNAQSIREWFPEQSVADIRRNQQDWPLRPITFDSISGTDGIFSLPTGQDGSWRIAIPRPDERRQRRGPERRLALIAHDHMKERMIEFTIDYESELDKNFSKIVTTSTTGSRIKEASRKLAGKVYAYHSGPKGGDIEIATEIMLGLIDVVIFFIDPLHPHPHIDDIRVVFGACMMQPVRMLTNERQAREWVDATLSH
ncbi:MAG TPA: methylglyoxal synthase [Thermoanaerobaculia bacterium]|nr:methylglyoxal synthase [Thermoanaerobaculia bacterium]